MGMSGGLVPQGLGSINSQLGANKVVAVWFDVQDSNAITAGGVNIAVTLNTPNLVSFLPSANVGQIDSTHAQIMYGKINGTQIVTELNDSADSSKNVATGNSYMQTNKFYSNNSHTGFWLQVSPTATHGQVVSFTVVATPANGVASAPLTFQTVIQ
jgi:hypothetical protein